MVDKSVAMGFTEILKAVILTMLWLHVDCCNECDEHIPSRPRPPIPMVHTNLTGSLPRCGPGLYIDPTTGHCKLCTEGAFVTPEMTRKFNNLQCLKCLEPKEGEVIKTSCTSYRDTELTCRYGWRRVQESDCPCTASCHPLYDAAPNGTASYWEKYVQRPGGRPESSPEKNSGQAGGWSTKGNLIAYVTLLCPLMLVLA